ncbi:hypothetical protein PPL_05338 [Heterostelium album PN500]|uniref:EGF-like domain-containing protein n=1 Tax=Heterostelium pallidum (strain ATCC 26659 / Pp 5 / PN500) TaxID=670386 RepID=D3B9W8_HETP5|nr:hypothetical protein PPL_05338 [Heterostelium album PN500]EFA81355.1 hypothetical protein PPL_05338 [Heterostelium album PN500]|eukprot:XP_020433473.1 hypothetical protein PPL_05338 [Heterostelium album PN500]
MKTLSILLFLFIFNNVFAQLELDPKELNSLRFLLAQYQIGYWNISATTCTGIQKTLGLLSCEDKNGYQTITEIQFPIRSQIDNGEPIYIDKLYFPSLTSIILGALGTSKNSSYSIINLLDIPDNKNLISMQISGITMDIPQDFPKYLNLTNMVLTSNTITSDLSLNSLLETSLVYLSIRNLSFTSSFKFTFNSSATINENLQTLIIENVRSLETYGLFNISDKNFKKLISMTLTFLLYENLELNHSLISTITVFNCGFSKEDLSEYNFFSLTITNNKTPLTKTFSLSNFQLTDTNTTGYFDNSSQLSNFTIYIQGYQNITANLDESFCSVKTLNIQGVKLLRNHVPDCFYCYWSYASTILPVNTPPPPSNFSCKISLDQYGYNLNPGEYIYIGGKNLGWGKDASPLLVPVTNNVQFRKKVILLKFFGVFLVIKVELIHEEIYNSSSVQLLLYGVFNLYAPLNITIQGKPCQIIYLSTYELHCTYPNFNSSEPVLVRTGDSISSVGLYISQPLSVRAFTYNNLFIITANFGMNPYNVSVYISDLTCNITVLNADLVGCIPTQSILPNIQYNVSLYANGFSSNFKLLITSKNNCGVDSKCNDHGSCVEGVCQCSSGYSGYYCESQLSPGVVILPNNTIPSPTIIVKDGMNFTFNIIAIQEIDELSSVVRELKTDKWSYSTTGNETFSITTYSLQSTSKQEVDQINATIEYSKNSRLIEFAGQSTLYPENSLKLMITINNWSFKDKLNRLRVLMESSSSIITEDECSPDLDITVNNGSDVNYLRMTINDVSFYGRFLPFALADNKPIFIQNQVVNQTKDNPDFSVLINTEASSASTCGSHHKFETWKIITIVVVCSVVILAATIATVITIKKKVMIRREDIKFKCSSMFTGLPSVILKSL